MNRKIKSATSPIKTVSPTLRLDNFSTFLAMLISFNYYKIISLTVQHPEKLRRRTHLQIYCQNSACRVLFLPER